MFFQFFARSLLLGALTVSAWASPALAQTASQPATQSLANNDPLQEARCSVQLKNASLAQMLSLLGNVAEVRFRYATPPDAIVSANLSDAPFLPTINNLLGAHGFDLRRQELNLWVFRSAPEAASLVTSRKTGARPASSLPDWPTSWQIWTRETPPSPNWFVPPAKPLARPGSKTEGISTAMRDAPALDNLGWKNVRLELDSSHRPGVRVDENVSEAARPRMRWPLWLRRVPSGTQLQLETSGEATLWANGAKVWSRWSGRRVLDLSSVLQEGPNSLAIEWTQAPPANARGEREPWLRYEWLFATTSD
jgi:hypothetical protein